MKRILLLTITLIFGAIATAQTVSTPNIGLQLPAYHSNNWNVPLNYNFTQLDRLLSGQQTLPGLGLGFVNVSGLGTFGSLKLPGITSANCLGTDNVGNIVLSTCTLTGGVTSFNSRVGAVSLQLADVTGLGTLANDTSGLAAKATQLNATPTLCTGGQVPTGILANGNATGCFSPGGGTVASFNTRTGAVTLLLADVTGLGTLANDTSGNAATASALAAAPTLCPGGQAPTGVLANGNATGCAAIGGGSSVQYDASNTNYVFSGTSFNADDLHVLGPSITATGGTCNGTTCIITNSGTNGLAVGDWVNVSGLTGWPAYTAPYGQYTFGMDQFQVISTGLSSTQFEFNYGTSATITGGTIYPSNYYLPQLFSTYPFVKGHGTVNAIFDSTHSCGGVDTNYTTMFHSISPVVTSQPGYFILNGCGNDIASGSSVATVKAHLQSIWKKAHTDGWIVIQGTMIIGNPGSLVTGDHTYALNQLNNWITMQGQQYTTITPYCSTLCGAYWDRLTDYASGISNETLSGSIASNGGLDSGGVILAANMINEALVNKASSVKTQIPFMYYGWYGSNLPFNDGPGWVWVGQNSLDNFVVTTSDGTTSAFAVDTKTTGGNIVGIKAPQVLISSIAASTNPICPNGTGGRLTTVGCVSGGITTNSLTINNSNTGDASGSSFNGSAAKTISTNSIGAPNLTSSNTYSGATTQDFSGVSQIKLPLGAGYASAAQGEVGYDTTNKNWHIWQNGADKILIPIDAATFTSGHCGAPTLSGGIWSFVDAGGPCGISGGGVTAWSGDGAMFDNASSTGSVVAHLANAAAHKFWGNNTGSSATPSYESITAADLTGIRQWSCQPGIGDGLNAVAAGTYLQTTCKNTTGVTVTLTGLSCFTDNSGSSTLNAAGNTLGALLTGAVTCSTSFAAGTQSANVLLTNGDYIKFTFVADGTSKQSTWVVTGTY